MKGFLGVSLVESREVDRDALPGGFRGAGVVVSSVTENQAAARAGLRIGDVIVAVNGERTPEVAVLRARIASRAAGETVIMRVVRSDEDGRADEIDLPVVLGAAVVDARGGLVPVPHGTDPLEYLASFDTELRRVDRTRRSLARAGVRELNARENDRGEQEITLLVTPNSRAWQSGLRDSDVVVSVAGQPIAAPMDLIERVSNALATSQRVQIPLQVRNAEGEVRTVNLTLERQ